MSVESFIFLHFLPNFLRFLWYLHQINISLINIGPQNKKKVVLGSDQNDTTSLDKMYVSHDCLYFIISNNHIIYCLYREHNIILLYFFLQFTNFQKICNRWHNKTFIIKVCNYMRGVVKVQKRLILWTELTIQPIITYFLRHTV